MSEVLPAAYGGQGWRTRLGTHREDMRTGLWRGLGEPTEVERLREVVLAKPDLNATDGKDPDELLFGSRPDGEKWCRQAEALGLAYERQGVTVHWAQAGSGAPAANFVFQRDLFFRTPEGVVLARPASQQRAIEARYAAGTLAALGVPILATPRGGALFEGADALWLDPRTVLIGIGTRTNREGFDFVSGILRGLSVVTVPVSLPAGVQHLLGVLNFVDSDLAVVRRGLAFEVLRTLLAARGIEVIEFSERSQAASPLDMNFVTLSPRRVLTQPGSVLGASLRNHGVTVFEFDASEYGRAAGGLGCATGVLCRSRV